MYHGTSSHAARSILARGFQRSIDGMLGPGVYLSRDLEKARRYPLDHPEHDKVVIRVVADVGKVIVIDYQGHPRQKTWQDPRYSEIYDTAWVPPNCGVTPVKKPDHIPESCNGPGLRRNLESAGKFPSQLFSFLWSRLKQSSLLQELTQSDPDTNIMYQWAEDDGNVPPGVSRLGLSEPASGRTYLMYHGTTRANAQSILRTGFRRSVDGMLGPGIYLSRDLEKAKLYPRFTPPFDKVIIKVAVNVGRVKKIDCQDHPLRTTWHYHGYNTAWVPPNCGMVSSGLEEDCVWDPNQIQILEVIYPHP
ncbi:uncharacterized protein LOC121529527 [Cheilinus undulatus]|uniref:uncharacterized protein LOC121529527 n=1 Tax=Cheilinus undulatus TaxID=241271 RepID=UPI001BD5C6FD|nr:uncharacterized protein LOC121529527 [Cheilinus undulatus]